MNATVKQADLLKDKPKEFTFLSLLPKQPPEGYAYYHVNPQHVTFVDSNNSHLRTIKLPFPIGSDVWMKETWAYDKYYKGLQSYFYKADCLEKPYQDNWHSPVTMPAEAIRHHYKAISVRVCQVGDVTREETFAIVCPDKEYYKEIHGSGENDDVLLGLFKQWFNARYGNKRRAHPITWEDNSWICITRGERE